MFDTEGDEIGDFVSDSFNTYDDMIDKLTVKEMLIVIKNFLTPKEYYILYHRKLGQDKYTLKALENKFYLSIEWIRQKEMKIIKKVKYLLFNQNFYKKQLLN